MRYDSGCDLSLRTLALDGRPSSAMGGRLAGEGKEGESEVLQEFQYVRIWFVVLCAGRVHNQNVYT
jgi:hypothetical protein